MSKFRRRRRKQKKKRRINETDEERQERLTSQRTDSIDCVTGQIKLTNHLRSSNVQMNL